MPELYGPIGFTPGSAIGCFSAAAEIATKAIPAIKSRMSTVSAMPYLTVNETGLLVPALVVTVVACPLRGAFELTWKVAVMLVELTTATLLTVTPLPAATVAAGNGVTVS